MFDPLCDHRQTPQTHRLKQAVSCQRYLVDPQKTFLSQADRNLLVSDPRADLHRENTERSGNIYHSQRP